MIVPVCSWAVLVKLESAHASAVGNETAATHSSGPQRFTGKLASMFLNASALLEETEATNSQTARDGNRAEPIFSGQKCI
jgi:hypothetical protein